MKRVEDSAHYRVPPVLVYFDDLERIAAIIGKGSNVSVKYGDFEYDELAEFKARFQGQTLRRKLVLTPTHTEWNARVSVTVAPDEARVWAASDADPAGIAVKHFLDQKSHWYSWTPTTSKGYLLIGALSMVLGLIMLALVAELASSGWLPLLLSGSAGVGGLLLLMRWTPVFGGSRVIVEDRELHMGFWTRNKDALLVNGIVALLGIAVGFALGRLVE